jgi:hypothetical protein
VVQSYTGLLLLLKIDPYGHGFLTGFDIFSGFLTGFDRFSMTTKHERSVPARKNRLKKRRWYHKSESDAESTWHNAENKEQQRWRKITHREQGSIIVVKAASL